ncbi:Gfo/Idh/MocA family protein [Vibrio splendidus]|uniref:Gfo/Idh/MocA family protein n=1 Tax=Vibrio splendidus TaxID=29497 RepID=UPI000C832447|nr:Gfo/Idh/MocA family oxidoreductase [Vibrio splendidus]PMO23477.1 myo-inositol 2-dehydrogenase [Vibrio splendidus]
MILMIGAGPMAQEYAKVLNGLGRDFVVVGRSEASAAKFQDATGVRAFVGGLDKFSESEDLQQFEFGIVTTGVEQLAPTTIKLIDYGIKNILVEKPAGLDAQEITELADYAASNDAKVYVAYNRRFFSSLLAAKDIIEQDGGVQSFNFELTEWGHVIAKLEKAEGVKKNWFLANTTHVTDMAFHLGGFPEQLSCFFSGGEKWHDRSYNFSGAGVSDSGALFAYHGNWGAPGRWSVEVLTSAHRLIFRPMEKLQIQKLGSVAIEPVEVDDSLDAQYKPGLYKQTEAFLNKNDKSLCKLSQQSKHITLYCKMAGYSTAE